MFYCTIIEPLLYIGYSPKCNLAPSVGALSFASAARSGFKWLSKWLALRQRRFILNIELLGDYKMQEIIFYPP